QRLARDFVSRFRELEGRRGATLGWREWIELVVELVQWDVRLAGAQEPGLSDALRTLQHSLRKDLATYISRNYPRWLAIPADDRPPLWVVVGVKLRGPAYKPRGGILLLVTDCLRLAQGEVLRDLVSPFLKIEKPHYLIIPPTATPFSRNAIFSG